MMLKKVSLGALALTAATISIPQAAQAQRYYRPYANGYAVPPPGPGYYGRNYARPRGYYHRGHCGGTTGAIIGGAAGALLGREIGRQSGGYRYDDYRGGYYKNGNGTVGAILGGAAGALLGREIDRSSC